QNRKSSRVVARVRPRHITGVLLFAKRGARPQVWPTVGRSPTIGLSPGRWYKCGMALPMPMFSYLAHCVNITCSAVILRPNLSHTPPASDPLPPLLPPCGPVLAPMGGVAASAATRKPPAADLSATRGVERGLLSPHNQFLDFGAEPRLHIIGNSLQYLRLLLGDDLLKSLHHRFLDLLRFLWRELPVLAGFPSFFH